MIQTLCDLCNCKMHEPHGYEVNIPRIVRNFATSPSGVKLMAFDSTSIQKTHLCKLCGNKIAMLFPVIE